MQATVIQPNLSLQEFILHNFISVTVSISDETTTLETDVPTQTLVGVLALWCSVLGFWMGLSAFTIFELVQLMNDLFADCKRNVRTCIITYCIDMQATRENMTITYEDYFN